MTNLDVASDPARLERFWSKVEKTNSCWNWKGTVTNWGYGHFAVTHSKAVRAHRLSYEMLCEEIPDGMVLDHLCQNKLCVNPDHLEVVTRQENTRRWAESRTVCLNGHPRTPENVVTRRGRRECKICVELQGRRRSEKASSARRASAA